MNPLLTILLLVLFGAVSYLLKRPYYGLPLDRDYGGHGIIALSWMRGMGLIYRDLYDSKTPGLKLIYMLIIRWLGISRKSFRFFFNMYNLLTLGAVFLLAQKLFGDVPALIAAGLYAIYSSMPSLWWHFSNTEEYYILPTILSFYFLLFSLDHTGTAAAILGGLSGLMAGIAFMFKQTSAINTLVLFLLYFFPEQGPYLAILGYLAGVAIPCFAFVIYFFVLKHVPFNRTPFGIWTLGLIGKYLRTPSFKMSSLARHQHRQTLRRIFYDCSALVLLSLGFLGFAFFGGVPYNLMAGLWMSGAVAGAIASRTYLPYHFIPCIPPACVMAGFVLSNMAASSQGKGLQNMLASDWLGIAAAAILIAAAIYHLVQDLFRTPQGFIGAIYSGVDGIYQLVEELGEYVKSQTLETDTVYSWGYEQGLFLWSERRCPTYNMFAPIINPSVYTEQELDQHFSELEADPPKFILVTASFEPFKRMEEFVTKNYVVDKKYPPVAFLFRFRMVPRGGFGGQGA